MHYVLKFELRRNSCKNFQLISSVPFSVSPSTLYVLTKFLQFQKISRTIFEINLFRKITPVVVFFLGNFLQLSSLLLGHKVRKRPRKRNFVSETDRALFHSQGRDRQRRLLHFHYRDGTLPTKSRPIRQESLQKFSQILIFLGSFFGPFRCPKV